MPRFFVPVLAVVTILSAAGTRAQEAPPLLMPVTTGADFCLEVQRALAATNHSAKNVVHPDYDAFKESKADIEPLTIHQFVQTSESDPALPERISCKTKTADQLNEHFGEGAARDTGMTCRNINRATVMAVWRSLSDEERARATERPDRIMLDADETTFMGSTWVKDYDAVYRTPEGELHLAGKALRVGWDDWWFAWAPDSVRGVHYCHLVAPEYLRRVILGEVSVPSL